MYRWPIEAYQKKYLKNNNFDHMTTKTSDCNLVIIINH